MQFNIPLLVYCVGGSKELAMLCESYSTATFVIQCFMCFTDEKHIN